MTPAIFDLKDQLITKIRTFHPGECPPEFNAWAWCVGGMRDDGEWRFEPMIRASYRQLRDCLRLLGRRKGRTMAIDRRHSCAPWVSLVDWLTDNRDDAILDAMYTPNRRSVS